MLERHILKLKCPPGSPNYDVNYIEPFEAYLIVLEKTRPSQKGFDDSRFILGKGE